jgi:hypothetical protein
MFKKLTFLWGAQHKFCMNYFIDTSSLEIEEKNRYTAIELASVIPAAGSDVYERLMAQNPWVKGYLSNGYCHFVPKPINVANKSPLLKRSLEFFLSAIFPDKLNYLLMDITDKKWKAKWRKRRYPMEEYGCAFKTTLHISKNHPANHQKKVLENLSKFEMPKQPNQKQPCLED